MLSFGSKSRKRRLFGLLGADKCIFNEHGDPNCATNRYTGNTVFKVDQDVSWQSATNFQGQNIGNTRYFWTFATMLQHVAKYFISNILNSWMDGMDIQIQYSMN